MDKPVFQCVIDESLESELEVGFVALVDKPAIERNFLAFKSQKMSFTIDEDRRIISGPAMLADMMIYRKDDVMGEYYATFDKKAITAIVQKFFRKGYHQNFNLMHDAGQKKSGITIFESFITDDARGIKPMTGFEDAKEGSWFMSATVDDNEVWEKIKSGELKGFSVEGLFKQVPLKYDESTIEQQLQKIVDFLQKKKL